MRGLEVESVTDRFEYLATVQVGRVVRITPHPQAPHLNICRVDMGQSAVEVVCGAPNLAADMLAPLALPDTTLPGGHSIRRSTIHGVLSEGMLCSPFELGLGSETDGIMQLDHSLVPGTALARALQLDDTVMEIGLTPNRADCLCMLGVAREVAAIQGTPLKYPQVDPPVQAGEIQAHTSVTLAAPEHCPRYAAQLLTDIQIAESPFWLQDRLISVGLRPVNNIVDITNYVMLECGQPLHAFDFDRLNGQRIVVRLASHAESFTTLDGKSRQLDDSMLVICDAAKPVALAGVMGGQNSEIDRQTTRVLLESACFTPGSIRRTAKKFGMNTDASHRFERGVNPAGTVNAMQRAATLMERHTGARLLSGYIDQNTGVDARRRLSVTTTYINGLLGTRIDRHDMVRLLKSIEFETRPCDDLGLEVDIPAFRVDVARPADIAEEVARLVGYDAIPVTFPDAMAADHDLTPFATLPARLCDIMTGLGFNETITYSFVGEAALARLELPSGDPRRRTIKVLNPISEDLAVMRTTLIPGLLQTLQRNLAHQNRNARLFEIGKTFTVRDDNQLPLEKVMLAGLWCGLRHSPSWHLPDTACDFYDLKGAVEALLSACGLEKAAFRAQPADTRAWYRSGCSALITIQGRPVGALGEIDANVLSAFDIKQAAFAFELDCKSLALGMGPEARMVHPLPRFPAVARDVTLIVADALEATQLLEHIDAMQEALVEDTLLFDVFQGETLPAGKKSLSIRVWYRSPDETLADETVNRLHERICSQLVERFGALLP